MRTGPAGLLVMTAVLLSAGCSGGTDPLNRASPSGGWTACLSTTPSPDGEYLWMMTITAGEDEVFMQDILYGFPADTSVTMKWDGENRLWLHRTGDRDSYLFWERINGEWTGYSWDITESWEFYPPEMD